MTVLKPFPYGDDGIHASDLAAGETHQIHEELTAGLVREGYIEIAPNDAGASNVSSPTGTAVGAGGQALIVEIPDDWATLAWPSLKALGAKIDPLAKTKPDCISAIEAELAKRAAAQDAAEGDDGKH